MAERLSKSDTIFSCRCSRPSPSAFGCLPEYLILPSFRSFFFAIITTSEAGPAHIVSRALLRHGSAIKCSTKAHPFGANCTPRPPTPVMAPACAQDNRTARVHILCIFPMLLLASLKVQAIESLFCFSVRSCSIAQAALPCSCEACGGRPPQARGRH